MAKSKKQFRLILKDTENHGVFVDVEDLKNIQESTKPLIAKYEELLNEEKKQRLERERKKKKKYKNISEKKNG